MLKSFFKKNLARLNQFLRLDAIRNAFSVVEVRPVEITLLVTFAVLFALLEGIGLTLLLPILEVAQGYESAIVESDSLIWRSFAAFLDFFNLPPTLPVLLVLAFIPILLRQVVFYINTWYSAAVGNDISVRMRMTVLDKIMDSDPDFFTRHPVGEIVGILLSQTNAAGGAVLAIIKQLSIALLIMLYVAILFAMSVPLTLTAVAFAVLVFIVVMWNIRAMREYAVDVARISQDLSSKIVERFSLMRLIKLRDQKAAEAKRVFDFSDAMRVLAVKQARLGAGVEVTGDPLLMLSAFVTLYVGVGMLNMRLAQLGMLLFILNRLNAKVKDFNGVRQIVSVQLSGITLVQEMTADAEGSNTIRRGPVQFTGLTDKLVLQDVKFEYPHAHKSDGTRIAEGKAVLHGISVTIPAGSFTALVGRSGVGKSTLVELLPRLRDATSGSITYDGVDIKEFDVGSLRKGIGYLTQSAMLFNETVRDNLIYGLDYEPTEEEIRAALEDAYASFVYELPRGLETLLGDQGVRFSGGERQRLALARVLLEDTSVLVLDEPTSSLDSESEAYIQKALANLHGKKTIIVIAHRLATVIQADQLLVIDNGRVIEQGTHDELVAMGAAYQKLFETQLLA